MSARIDRELLAWIDRRRGRQTRTEFIRDVLRERKARERELEVRRTFDRAGEGLGPEDIVEREDLISAFGGRGRAAVPPRPRGGARFT